MGTFWLPGARLLLAAVLLACASALPLSPAYEDQGQSLGTSALKGDGEKLLALNSFLVGLVGLSSSTEKAAPGIRAGVLGSEGSGTSGTQTAPLTLPLHLKPHWDQLALPGVAAAKGRATARSALSAVAEHVAHRAPESWPTAPGSAEEIWITGSSETITLSQASPGPKHLGIEPDLSEHPGLPVTVRTPAYVTLRAFVASKPAWQLVGAPPAPPTPAPMSGGPQPLTCLRGRHLSTSIWMQSTSGVNNIRPEASSPLAWAPGAPEEAIPSVPQGPFVLTSTGNTLATTEPLPHAAPGFSALGTAFPALTGGSRLPRDAVTARLGPQPSGPLMSPLPSKASPSQSSLSPPQLSSSSSPSPALLSLSLSPSPSSPTPRPPFQIPTMSLVSILPPNSLFTTRARTSPDPAVPALTLTTTDLTSISSLPPAQQTNLATEPASVWWTAQPGPAVPDSPALSTTLSLGHVSSPPSGFPSVPGGAGPAQWSPLSPPGQAISSQDSGASFPQPHRVTRSLTFRITNEAFSGALRNPASLDYQLLSKNIRDQLQPMYNKAFSSFQRTGVLFFRPGYVTVNAFLVFGGRGPSPSAQEVLWTLYCKVKAKGLMMGNLSLEENSLASDGFNLTDLARELVRIRFTSMRPFLPQLLVPDSAPATLLGEEILRQVTPTVSGFYKVQPQGRPLLLFRAVDQWVGVYIEYKFQTSIFPRLRGLANHLAQHIMDPTFQKSSIRANGEKAELVLCEVWLQIPDLPFTKALEDKTSPEFQKLGGTLTRWLTAALSPLQNFAQVVVEQFQLDPLIAKVDATFLGAVPTRALIQGCVLQGLHALQEAEGFSVEVVEVAIPDQGTPSPKALSQPGMALPGYAVVLIVLGILLVTFLLVLVLKRRTCHRLLGLGRPEPCLQSSCPQ